MAHDIVGIIMKFSLETTKIFSSENIDNETIYLKWWKKKKKKTWLPRILYPEKKSRVKVK